MDEKKRMNAEERESLFGLYAMHTSMKDFCKPLEHRMKSDRWALRGLRSASRQIERALNAVLGTLDDTEKQYVAKNSLGFRTKIVPVTIVKDPVWMYVKIDDLKQLISIAKKSECAMCMLDRQQQGSCQLRKTLGILVDEPKSIFGCGFKGGDGQ